MYLRPICVLPPTAKTANVPNGRCGEHVSAGQRPAPFATYREPPVPTWWRTRKTSPLSRQRSEQPCVQISIGEPRTLLGHGPAHPGLGARPVRGLRMLPGKASNDPTHHTCRLHCTDRATHHAASVNTTAPDSRTRTPHPRSAPGHQNDQQDQQHLQPAPMTHPTQPTQQRRDCCTDRCRHLTLRRRVGDGGMCTTPPAFPNEFREEVLRVWSTRTLVPRWPGAKDFDISRRV